VLCTTEAVALDNRCPRDNRPAGRSGVPPWPPKTAPSWPMPNFFAVSPCSPFRVSVQRARHVPCRLCAGQVLTFPVSLLMVLPSMSFTSIVTFLRRLRERVIDVGARLRILAHEAAVWSCRASAPAPSAPSYSACTGAPFSLSASGFICRRADTSRIHRLAARAWAATISPRGGMHGDFVHGHGRQVVC